MKTILVVCDDRESMIKGVYILSSLYKTYQESDGHKIFLAPRENIFQITNSTQEHESEDPREVIFVSNDYLDVLNSRKNVVKQMSSSRISTSKNAEINAKNLINWLICKVNDS